VDKIPPYSWIAKRLIKGRIIPFFGAGASAVCRPQGALWQPGRPYMPSGEELAASLASAAQYPRGDGPLPGLAVVASWAEHVQGSREDVENDLRECFAVECEPGPLHATLAKPDATKLYLTTNYDDLVERSLASRNVHVLIDGGAQGLTLHKAGEKPRQVSAIGDELHKLLSDKSTQQPAHPIVYKMHGSIDKTDKSNDRYLITEEDYVDFLGRPGDSYIPPYIAGLIEDKAILLLGYSLMDWNVRLILRKILKRDLNRPIWAIVSGHSEAEQELWQARELRIFPVQLQKFADELSIELAKYL
jgi:hypothetical protein